MGTTWRVTVVEAKGLEVEALRTEVSGEIERLEAMFSHWRADSEVSRLNAAEEGEEVSLSSETRDLLAEAEAIRVASREAAAAIHRGERNPLRELLAADPRFAAVADSLDELLDGARFVGRAPEQVLEFVEGEVDPLLARYADLATEAAEIRV